ncbi:MAG: VOC family protein [Dongiaceae bacterium]
MARKSARKVARKPTKKATRKPAKKVARKAARKVTRKVTRKAPKKVRAIPKGYRSVTPYLVLGNAVQAIEFYKQAFGAVEIMRMAAPSAGKLVHAELKIGGSIVMLGDDMGGGGMRAPTSLGGAGAAVFLYVKDADATFARAVRAGATVIRPLADMFWGDRYGRLRDPFGHVWEIATHLRDVSPAEMQKAQAALSQPQVQTPPRLDPPTF